MNFLWVFTLSPPSCRALQTSNVWEYKPGRKRKSITNQNHQLESYQYRPQCTRSMLSFEKIWRQEKYLNQQRRWLPCVLSVFSVPWILKRPVLSNILFGWMKKISMDPVSLGSATKRLILEDLEDQLKCLCGSLLCFQSIRGEPWHDSSDLKKDSNVNPLYPSLTLRILYHKISVVWWETRNN